MSKHPVVVYAASGYTGKLTCESLMAQGIAFTAAGRNQERLDAVVKVWQGQGATCDAQAINHDVDSLTELFTGSKVVINISGPFSALGEDVVEASFRAGCHYVDSTGEQDFMLDIDDKYSAKFEEANLCLMPSCSFLWAPGTCAAEIALETPGIDSVKIFYAPPNLQTVASLQSMIRTSMRDNFVIADGKMETMALDIRKILVPGLNEMRSAVPVGAGEASFFRHDSRVKNCETLFTSDDLAKAIPFMKVGTLASKLVPQKHVDRVTDKLVLLVKKDPPAEDPANSRYVAGCIAEGNSARAKVIIYGVSPYATTGFLCADAAERILKGEAKRYGFASMAQAFGARNVLDGMGRFGAQYEVESSAELNDQSLNARKSLA
ncbi:MAG: saccharopine dehydrogenase [Moraxellaceae bacterium]|nr:MAG: saccharopine dehydrogenase [Moraxellaceae bacterium]